MMNLERTGVTGRPFDCRNLFGQPGGERRPGVQSVKIESPVGMRMTSAPPALSAPDNRSESRHDPADHEHEDNADCHGKNADDGPRRPRAQIGSDQIVHLKATVPCSFLRTTTWPGGAPVQKRWLEGRIESPVADSRSIEYPSADARCASPAAAGRSRQTSDGSRSARDTSIRLVGNLSGNGHLGSLNQIS